MLAHVLFDLPLRPTARTEECGIADTQGSLGDSAGLNGDRPFDDVHDFVRVEVPAEAPLRAIPDVCSRGPVFTHRPLRRPCNRCAEDYPVAVDWMIFEQYMIQTDRFDCRQSQGQAPLVEFPNTSPPAVTPKLPHGVTA